MTAAKFGARPSALLDIEDSVVALAVDMAGCLTVWREEARARESADGVDRQRVVL